ncbi:hypothetical protein MFIFM68171_07515 [Madurella fahalii]|uniref:Uncharacterized protein n=1 Tax=Madurella fahalii TaxID=1157608 RepID=A0ABQ0GHY9_9PEZI
MGAEQSAPRGSGNQAAAAATRKTCYYELLGVDRQVPDEEIRKAYKKKALELHPDRNLNDIENATRKFAEVQTAYEILSDPQERAWYDTHRDAILSGEEEVAGAEPAEQSRSGHTSAKAIFALMSRFNSSVAMDDSPRGFFGILNEFFDQLAAEETAACEWAGIAPTEYPAFGRAKDDYNAVAKPFYNVWASFSTKKIFSWRDKYRLQEAPDRRIRRLMEKENKKFRDEGIREFNDAVLSLVAFVKKRDPRYVPNKQSEAERQRVLRNSAAAQAARSRAANQEKLAEYVVPDWAQARDDEEQNDEFSLSEEESEVEQIECVVCNKTFKSEKQFEAHEKSKKHVKAVQQLQRQMRKENANFDLEETEAASSPALPASKESEDEEDGARVDPDATSRGNGVEKQETRSPIEEDSIGNGALSPSDTEDDEYAPRSAVEERILSGKGKDPETTLSERDEETGTMDSAAASISDLALGEGKGDGKKIGKAKLKREKKAARQAAEAEAPGPHKCAVCKETFMSRTKLFSHIKEFNHATPVPNAKAGKKKRH